MSYLPRSANPAPSFVSSRGDRVHISAALFGGPAHESVSLCIVAAYELGRELVDASEALLAGVSRPWDQDADRTPFVSRSFGRAGARSVAVAPAGVRAGSRPTRAVDSRR